MPRIDVFSETWVQVRDRASAAIEVDRAKLESPGLSHDDSNILRGRIAAHREILALASPAPGIVPGPETYLPSRPDVTGY